MFLERARLSKSIRTICCHVPNSKTEFIKGIVDPAEHGGLDESVYVLDGRTFGREDDDHPAGGEEGV
jgi:hypothetical protein